MTHICTLKYIYKLNNTYIQTINYKDELEPGASGATSTFVREGGEGAKFDFSL